MFHLFQAQSNVFKSNGSNSSTTTTGGNQVITTSNGTGGTNNTTGNHGNNNNNLNTSNNSTQPMQIIPKPVECNLCHRKFKNIPALNGHMRLHGGYFKKVCILI